MVLILAQGGGGGQRGAVSAFLAGQVDENQHALLGTSLYDQGQALRCALCLAYGLAQFPGASHGLRLPDHDVFPSSATLLKSRVIIC
jgi:hypothetical protein